MEFEDGSLNIIPEQDLEGKVANVAKITNIFNCTSNGKRNFLTDSSEFVRIQIENITSFGGSGLVYSQEQFQEFLSGYNLDKNSSYTHLIGKPVLSVYCTKTHFMSGLVPLNM